MVVQLLTLTPTLTPAPTLTPSLTAAPTLTLTGADILQLAAHIQEAARVGKPLLLGEFNKLPPVSERLVTDTPSCAREICTDS